MSKIQTKLLLVIGAVFSALVLVAPAAQATTPAKGYENFAGCPSPAEEPKIDSCVRSVVTSGTFKMGNKNVPITAPITFSGGINLSSKFVYNSKGGLNPVTKQKVPGGVIGLTGLTWLAEFLGIEALTLYAATELAGTPGSPFDEPFVLPIKVHLINSALGSSCYVGSTASPIKLNLITGTTAPPLPNKPISGHGPEEFEFDNPPGTIHANKIKFVDNSFAAPGASGCVLTLFGFIPISINGLVNTASGLPAAAGTNETIQNADSELVEAKLVYP